MFDFNYFMPTRIVFGPGKLSDTSLGKFLPRGDKAMVVIGESGAMIRHGYYDKVLAILETAGIRTVLYDAIRPNPESAQVDEAAAKAREMGVDFIVGLGGGSTIDSAKSIALMANNPGQYWDYIVGGSGGGKTPENPALPVVAVPTTSGTGTEADPWTVITKSGSPEKIGWGNDSTFPHLSIVDPECTVSVPAHITAHTGMDAFFHAAEAYLATVSQPTSDLLALEAVAIINALLPQCVADGENVEIRSAISWASTAAGICESLSSCISHHSLEHAISAHYPDVPHGLGLIMLAPAYFEFMADHEPERCMDLARAMNVDVDALEDKDKPLAFAAALRTLIKDIGMGGETLSSWGVKKEDCPELARTALETMGGLFEVTPVEMDLDVVTKIFEKAWK